MSVKTLEVDGRMITGLAGETIFSVAWEHGIHIPRLCHIGIRHSWRLFCRTASTAISTSAMFAAPVANSIGRPFDATWPINAGQVMSPEPILKAGNK